MGAGIERKNLCARQYEIIVLLEESPHCLIPGRAHDRGVEYLERAQSQPALHFPLCFRFHQRAFCRICIKLLELAADLPGAQRLPVFPDAIDRVVRPRLLHRAAERLQHADRVLAKIEHAWLETQISAETSCPGHAGAPEIAPQRLDDLRGILAVGQGRARIVSGQDREQHGQIGHAAGHRPGNRERGVEGVGHRRRDPSIGGAEPEHVVERGGIAQRAAMVAAVGNRQHAKRERHRRAPAAAARGLGWIVRVERGAEYRVISLRAQSEFRRIGLADDDAAGPLDPLHVDRVLLRNDLLENRGSLCGADALSGRQVLDGLRKPVHPTHAPAVSERIIAFPCLLHQVVGVLQRHDRVHLRVDPADMVEIGAHHFGTGYLSGLDGPRELDRVHHHDLGYLCRPCRGRSFAGGIGTFPSFRSRTRGTHISLLFISAGLIAEGTHRSLGLGNFRHEAHRTACSRAPIAANPW